MLTGSGHSVSLQRLHADVASSRAQLNEVRGQPAVRVADAVAARGELAAALEALVDELTRRRIPIPYALRDEVRLVRQLR